MPLPTDTLLRVQASPVPTHTTCGLDGSIVTAPIDCTGCLSNTGLNVVPPSVDFHTPPLAAPTYNNVLPSTLRAATAAMRPLMVAEPMLRMPSPEMVPESKRTAAASCANAVVVSAASAKAAAMLCM